MNPTKMRGDNHSLHRIDASLSRLVFSSTGSQCLGSSVTTLLLYYFLGIFHLKPAWQFHRDRKSPEISVVLYVEVIRQENRTCIEGEEICKLLSAFVNNFQLPTPAVSLVTAMPAVTVGFSNTVDDLTIYCLNQIFM